MAYRIDPVVDLGMEQGAPFLMAFCFPPSGKLIVQGARDRVMAYVDAIPGTFHLNLAPRGQAGEWVIKGRIGVRLDCAVTPNRCGGVRHRWSLIIDGEAVTSFRKPPNTFIKAFGYLEENQGQGAT